MTMQVTSFEQFVVSGGGNLAIMSVEGFAAAASAVVIISGGVAAAVMKIMQARHKVDMEASAVSHEQEQENERYASEEYTRIIDRQEKHIDRQDAQLGEYQRLATRLYAAISECRESEALTYGQLKLFHDICCRHATALRELGVDVEIPAPMEVRPQRISILDEFEVRTTAQRALLASEISDRIKKEKADRKPRKRKGEES